MASNGIQIAALILAIVGTVIAYFATSKSTKIPESFSQKNDEIFNIEF